MLIRLKHAFVLAAVALAAAGPLHAADGKLNVVASSTFFEDLVKRIGGDKVEVKHVASPKVNVHFYQPKPSDVRNVSKADLYVNGGLDLEAWSEPLLEAVGNPALFRGGRGNVDLSQGIALTAPPALLSRAAGDQHLFGNPHYVMNPEHTRIMARTLAERLKEADPANAAVYEENERAFQSKLDAKIAEWKAECSSLAGKEIFSYHDDIAYFAQFVGLKVERFLEPKPGIPPTPKHLEELERYAKESGVKVVVTPTYFAKGAAEALAKRIGGTVAVICQNAGEVPGTEDIFTFFDYNFKTIADALR
ncbi:MAG TPA: metal ABC transporter substrate-binding protein [Candidatus Eisenbacteria bacterium]|jgi:ABC-type Zn uptake system ZnuABC Zn-binding protein ZnuA|nr:metal ABC transporter substrate-binding protein [Candidatus Eisenbacteria bacterium]